MKRNIYKYFGTLSKQFDCLKLQEVVIYKCLKMKCIG